MAAQGAQILLREVPGATSSLQGLPQPQSFESIEQLTFRSPGNALAFIRVHPAPLTIQRAWVQLCEWTPHYHVWYYSRSQDGTISSTERDETAYTTRRKANYALSDRHQYWKAGQVLQ